ncbi:Cytochrome oxidase assembly factor 4 [Basidiobolus ranarum]|uniref:Cytochrome oxidase assembly factor 4 n=1 Tax=Basidiobolus ranarum TaxID=34480 RepID=A0ABR2X3M2_9FUNG
MSSESTTESKLKVETQATEEEEEEDEYELRIKKTGCYDENEALQLCFYDTKDWRQCKDEMEKFRSCWKKHQNQ